MSLLDDLQHADEVSSSKTSACALCWAIERLPEDEANALSAASLGTIGFKSLVYILRSNGIVGPAGRPIGEGTVTRHRKEAHSA